MSALTITTEAELIRENIEDNTLTITENISLSAPLHLAPGVTLQGPDSDRPILIQGTTDLLEFSQNNQLRNLELQTTPQQRALYNESDNYFTGNFSIQNVTVTGLVAFIIKNGRETIHFDIDDLFIVNADATQQAEHPEGFGVAVLQGALTLWNQSPLANVSAVLKNIRLGNPNQPVYGSGVFIAGSDDASFHVEQLETNEIFINGLIPADNAQLISGGVFILKNVFADKITQRSTVTTFSANDMILDNWGSVKEWVVNDQLISYGPSAIGFVNFGFIEQLLIKEDIETFGTGARGINNYEGTIQNLELRNIRTHGDGAVGVQISKPLGDVLIRGSVETSGNIGRSLVKGVIKELPASAISILPEGHLNSLKVTGDVLTYNNTPPLLIEGTVENGLRIRGKIQQFISQQYD